MKWGSVKQARQQAKRMEAKGIRTDASETFKAAQKAIKDNIAARIERINENADLTKKEKTAQRKAARRGLVCRGASRPCHKRHDDISDARAARPLLNIRTKNYPSHWTAKPSLTIRAN